MSLEYQPAEAVRKRKRRDLLIYVRLVGVIVMVLAAPIPAALSVWYFCSTTALLRTAVRTQGTVVALKESSSENGVSYRAVFRFTDGAGQSHEVTSNIGSNPASNTVGEVVPVVYDPAKPSRARIADFLHLWGGAVITGGMAVGFVVLGFLVVKVGPMVVRRFWPEGSAVTPAA